MSWLISQCCHSDKEASQGLPNLSAHMGRLPRDPSPTPTGGRGRMVRTPFHTHVLVCGGPDLATGVTYLKTRRSTPAPGLCPLRSWWLHLGLGRGRTDSTGAALGVPQPWTAERRRWEKVVRPQLLPNQRTSRYLVVCMSIYVTDVCPDYKSNKYTLHEETLEKKEK